MSFKFKGRFRGSKKSNGNKSMKAQLERTRRDLSNFKKKVSVEIKNYDKDNSAAIPDQVGWDGEMAEVASGMEIGDAIGEREGVKIYATSMQLKAQLFRNNVASSFRVLVVIDKQNSSIITTDYLLDAGTTLAPFSMHPSGTRKRYTVLYDRTFSLSPVDDEIVNLDLSIPIKKKIMFATGSGNVPILTNSPKIIFISDKNVPTETGPTIKYNTRLRYTDA